MPAPVLGLPALLQALATIGVGGAVGYKAQKDLQPVIKSLKNSPEDMDSSELKMLRALLLPNQAVAQELKDMTTSRSVKATGDGLVFAPDADEIEKQKEDLEILLKPPTRAPEPVKPVIEIFPDQPKIKEDPPVQPEVDLETKETFPDLSEEINKPQIFEQKENKGLVGVNSQEGGKIIKDVTAGVSAQKDTVPSLLEQGALAKPIKDFFNENDQVVNYKIGDTVGAYGKDVERSLDIEANVKPDFNIDKFGEVIKQRAKEFDQDAVFVAETVTKDSEGANVGFDIDFGSDLKMKEALNVGNSISRIAELDGFTFKIKNLDTSGTSLYLPQSKKDLELIEKTLKKYPVTEDIRKAGFIMPDGKMLNFSLRGGNVRDTEHRRVGFMVQEGYDGESFGPMYDWMMKTGGIRITGNQNRLFAEVAGKPTTTQINKIVEEYNTNRDKYDSMIIGVTIPGEGQGSSIAPRQDFGRDIGLNLANNLRNAEFRLPSENFYEVTGENANASDIIRKLQSTDIVGKTFTGIRQLNIPEFSNISPEEAFNKVGNLYNNMQEIIDSTNIKTLDKPKVKFYKTKVFKKGKDY
jgi:hypothetical protein